MILVHDNTRPYVCGLFFIDVKLYNLSGYSKHRYFPERVLLLKIVSDFMSAISPESAFFPDCQCFHSVPTGVLKGTVNSASSAK